jgi:hypothetical protein
VTKDVIINYEAGKIWLNNNFENYLVMLVFKSDEETFDKIVLSAWSWGDEEEKTKTYTIGQGNTFSSALKQILQLV